MNPKTRNIIGWALTIALAGFLLFSAAGKFMDNEQMRAMLPALGLTAEKARIIGIVEIVATLLFLIPRTGVLGSMLLAAYLGGAIATHVTHPEAGPATFAILIQCVLFITAAIRFPELNARLLGRRA